MSVRAPLAVSEDGPDWINLFNEVVEKIATAYPNSFAGADVSQVTPVIMFKGAAPEGALQLLKSLDVEYDIRTDLEASEKELSAATEAAHFSILGSLPEGTEITSEPDVRSATITTTVGLPADSLDPATPSEEQDVFIQAVQDETAKQRSIGIDLKVVADPSLVTRNNTSYGFAGGVKLTGSVSSCTSGFVVKARYAPDLGVITAGHCPDALRQIQPNGTIVFDFRNDYIGPDGDYQWMRSPVMMDAWFHYDFGLGRPVQGSRTVSTGQTIWKFGYVGGRDSSTVRSISTCLGNTCNLVRTHTQILSSGDSGGPWYYGNYAYGTSVGDSFDSAGASSYFNPIRSPLSRFSLKLCIDFAGEPVC